MTPTLFPPTPLPLARTPRLGGTSPVRSVPASVRRLAGVVVALTLATGATALVGGPAAAHDSVVGTTPEDSAVLDTAPTSATVTLSDAPQAIGPRMIVTDQAGTVVLDEEPVITDRVASVELPALGNGTYQVAWRVVSSDGHPIQDVYSFTVAAPVPDPPVADAPAPDAPAPDAPAPDAPATDVPASDAATASSDPVPTPPDGATEPTDASAGEGSSSTAVVAGAVVVVVAVALAGLVLVRRRSALRDDS